MGGTVLVIDDDADTCELVQKALTVAGHAVLWRTDGDSALATFRESPADVVITDVRMPGMDGLQVLRAVRLLDPEASVIIFSATVEDRTRVAIDALRGGAVDYLVKPLAEISELERAVARAMDRRRERRDIQKRLVDLEQRVRTDPLTGLANRLELEQRLREEFSRLGRGVEELSLALFDIDYFKVVNDGHGHQAGDRILTVVARAIRESCRAYDVKARYGGDEFVVVMPDTRLEQGIAVAEKIRRAVAVLAASDSDRLPRVTLSAGVTSTGPHDGLAPEDLIRKADLALYEAKKRGRDRIVQWDDSLPAPGILLVDPPGRRHP